MQQRIDGGYGWIAVSAAFASHFIAFGVIYSFTVFFPSILEDFGRGRGWTASIASIAAGLMLGVGGLTGKLSDRFGPRPVIAAGGVLIGSGLLLTSIASHILHVYLAYGLILGVGVSCAFVPSVATVGQWFEKRRGLATGIAVSGTGIGSLVLAPLSSELIDSSGWRSAMRVLALISVVTVIAAASVMRSRTAAGAGRSVRDLVRGSRTFKLLFLSSLIASYGYWIPFVHVVPFAEDREISKLLAAAVVAVMGIANTVGRILMGGIADRFGRYRMMRFSSLALAAAMFLWPLTDSFESLAIFGAVYGAFAGAFIAMLPALAGDYFGMERLAGITGLLFSGAAIGTLFGAPVTGLLFDALGSYTLGILLGGGSLVVGTVLLYMIPPPQAPQGIGGSDSPGEQIPETSR